MKNCNNCIKRDVCNHYKNIYSNFQNIAEITFGGIGTEYKDKKEILDLVAKLCRFYVFNQELGAKRNGKI